MGFDNQLSKQKETILFALMNGSDNIESFQTLIDALLKREFIIVLTTDSMTAKLFDQNSNFKIFASNCYPPNNLPENCTESDLNALNGSPIDNIKTLGLKIFEEKFNFIKSCEDFNEKIVKSVKPDLIIVESMVCSPALTNSGIPWIWFNFGPPNLYYTDTRIGPGWSGKSENNVTILITFLIGLGLKDSKEFEKFRKKFNEIFSELKNKINEWCVSKGAPKVEENIAHPHSPYLNFYVYPTELDYKLEKTWTTKNRIQSDILLKRKTSTDFVIPQSLRSKSGRLIYLSMGSFASLQLLKRLTTILSESPNKFIVSKGQFHNELELPNNMWGTEYIPIDSVIQSVDLVITCGDNNSINKCLLNAKPMIVLPIFGTELDNRIRLKEKGFGWGLDPFDCNKGTLLCMIETTLDDKFLSKKLINISDSIYRSQPEKQIIYEIENIFVRNNN